MPVKVRQKQTRKIEWVTYHEYFHNINKNLYDTLEIKNIYELYNSISGSELWQATVEKEDAIKALNDRPDIFRIEYFYQNTQSCFLFKKTLNFSSKDPINNNIVKTKIAWSVSKWIINNLYLFIFYVAVAVVAFIICKRYF